MSRNHTQVTAFNYEIRRLHGMWAEWQRYERDGGPAKSAHERFAAFKASLLERIEQSRLKTKDRWRERIEAACAPAPQSKPRTTSRATRTEDLSIGHRFPLWPGPTGEGELRRVVAVTWSNKVGRWAIRISTRLGDYWNTHTEGLSLEALAYTADHMKCVLTLRGFLSPLPGMTKSAWNDYECAQEKLECGVELDLDNARHAHLNEWIVRIERREKQRAGGYICTLHSIPKYADVMRIVNKALPKASRVLGDS